MPKLIDLSHPLVHGQLNFPNDPKLGLIIHATVKRNQYNLTHISMSSHQGTHLDAPYHFLDHGKTLDQLTLDRFYGPATLVDLAPGSALAPKTPLTIEMFQKHEAAFRPGAKVIYRTGWNRTFNTDEFFTDFPTLTLDAARWMAERKIGLIGMDTGTPSVQYLECHHILLGADMVIVEGLTNLDKLPKDFTFIGFPLNMTGRDGSPIRAVGVVE